MYYQYAPFLESLFKLTPRILIVCIWLMVMMGGGGGVDAIGRLDLKTTNS